MKARSRQLSQTEIAQVRLRLDGSAALDQAAHLIRLAGSPTRLKILYLLNRRQELAVGELGRALGLSISGVSQQLTKLKGAGLVAMRRHRQTIYTRLTPHAFNASLRRDFFRPSAPRRRGPGSRPGTVQAHAQAPAAPIDNSTQHQPRRPLRLNRRGRRSPRLRP